MIKYLSAADDGNNTPLSNFVWGTVIFNKSNNFQFAYGIEYSPKFHISNECEQFECIIHYFYVNNTM